MATKFPDKGLSSWVIKFRITTAAREVGSWGLDESLGSLHCKPHPISEYAWKKLMRLNPNNLGNWSIEGVKVSGTTKIERDLILSLVDLLGGEGGWEGYVTSGATESNILSVWIGRNFLQRETPKRRICVVINDLTHYSVLKAADICNIDLLKAPLSRGKWAFDVQGLLTTVKNARGKYKGFLVPLTLGYTQTGTNDDYGEITQRLKVLENEVGIKTCVFIDAALNGLVLPFIRKEFRPLENENIQSFCFDFHKTGMTPIPCGVILYKSGLRRYIEKAIPYIAENDSTLLGSRSGIPAVAAWSVMMRLGKEGFKKVIYDLIERKLSFKSEVQKNFPEVEIIDEGSLSIGLVSKNSLPDSFLLKYKLFAKKQLLRFIDKSEKLLIYKVSFLA